MRSTPSNRAFLAATAIGLALLAPGPLHAQLPGAPVLQNAFANPGITVAGNYAKGDNTALAALAAAYAPGAGSFQFSGGIGRLTIEAGEGEDDQSATAWGARLAVPRFSFAGGRAGIAPFVGFGAASVDSVKLVQVPVGVGAGWRMGLGATRALSVFATGTWLWARTTVGDERESANRIRVAAGADVTVIRNLGLTVGFEGGANAKDDEPGPSGSIFGVGLSWAFR